MREAVEQGVLKMLSSRASDGCPGWVDSEVIGVVISLRRVHAWSLVIAVKSVVIATIVVVVVLLPLTVDLLMHLEPRGGKGRCLLTPPLGVTMR